MRVEHVSKLLTEFPLGIIILFEYELVKWQKTIKVDNNCLNIFEEIIHVPTERTPHIKKSYQLIQLDDILNTSTQESLIIDYYKKKQ